MSFLSTLTRPSLAFPRTADDVDVVAATHKQLTEAGLPFATTWLEEAEIQEAKDKNPQLQCFLISRNLNFKLLTAANTQKEDNMTARVCLGSQAMPEEYLTNLEQYVIPCLQKEYGNLQ